MEDGHADLRARAAPAQEGTGDAKFFCLPAHALPLGASLPAHALPLGAMRKAKARTQETLSVRLGFGTSSRRLDWENATTKPGTSLASALLSADRA